jgi:hypothetical protein
MRRLRHVLVRFATVVLAVIAWLAPPRAQRVEHALEEVLVPAMRLLTPEGRPLLPGLPAET